MATTISDARYSVQYLLDEEGGFTVGNCLNGLTSYAYPTSRHATIARTMPGRIANEMARKEMRLPHREEYDARNWARLAAHK